MGLRSLADLLLPPGCAICLSPLPASPAGIGPAAAHDGASRIVCGVCDRQIRSLAWPVASCRRCGRLWVSAGGAPKRPASTAGRFGEGGPQRAECDACRGDAWRIDRVIAMCTYRGLVRDAVVQAKFSHHAAVGRYLGHRLGGCVAAAVCQAAECVDADPAGPADRGGTGGSVAAGPYDVVTYVPSHVTRQLSRGGIGTRVIAAEVAARIGCPVQRLLRLRRKLKKQAWLDDVGRMANVRDAFAVKKGYALPVRDGLTGQRLLLVDDVMTTGATANEIARVLKLAGALRVDVAVVARAAGR